MRVLVVEDEEYLAEAIATGLRREAMAVDVVGDGASALEQVVINDYDIIVLDRGSIVEEGSHEELLALGGWYADLWRIWSANR